jgi:hypothetical protein
MVTNSFSQMKSDIVNADRGLFWQRTWDKVLYAVQEVTAQ